MHLLSMRNLTFLCLFILLPLSSKAQDALAKSSIVEKINHSTPGKGKVKVIQEASITERLGKPGKSVDLESVDKYIEVNGFRIQVFAGNNQRVAKNEAYTKETDIKSIFPELSTYVGFTAPFWRLRVGDFQTFQEAQRTMTKLRSKFPAFGREMSIVKEKVRIKVQ